MSQTQPATFRSRLVERRGRRKTPVGWACSDAYHSPQRRAARGRRSLGFAEASNPRVVTAPTSPATASSSLLIPERRGHSTRAPPQSRGPRSTLHRTTPNVALHASSRKHTTREGIVVVRAAVAAALASAVLVVLRRWNVQESALERHCRLLQLHPYVTPSFTSLTHLSRAYSPLAALSPLSKPRAAGDAAVLR